MFRIVQRTLLHLLGTLGFVGFTACTFLLIGSAAQAADLSFSSAKTLNVSAQGARFVYATDLDGDGYLDVISASETDDEISWYKNVWSATLTFTPYTVTEDPTSPYDGTNGYADGPQSIYAIDVDGDGDMDLLSASDHDNRIAWYESDGAATPTFTPHTISTAPKGARAVYADDLDDDGDVDVLCGAYDEATLLYYEVSWFESDGASDPSFSRRVVDDVSARYPEWVYATDLDDDNNIDLLSADGEYIHWFQSDGNADPTFALKTVSPYRDADRSAYPCDMDEDGALDVVAVSVRHDKIVWYENNEDSPLTFIAHDIATSLSDPRSVYPVDLDDDGDQDVLCTTYNDDTVRWYENIGSATSFTPHTISTTADGAECVFAADLDGDGDQDVLCASYEDDTIAWYENTLYSSGPEVEVFQKVKIGGEDYTYVLIDDGGGPIDYYSAWWGSTPQSRRFYVHNAGSADLTTSNLSVPPNYSIVQALASNIPRGTTATFEVELSTDVPGTHSGTISFNNNDSDENPFDFTVTGKILAAEVDVSVDGSPISDGGGPVDFGTTSLGGSALTKIFTVTNNGDGNLLSSNLTVPQGYIVTESLDFIILPSNSDTFTVELSSATPGTVPGTVSFDTNDPDEDPFNFTVTGTVLAPHIAIYNRTILIPNGGGPVDFGTPDKDGPYAIEMFKVKNEGDGDLVVSGVGVSGGGGAFGVGSTAALANPIPPGGSVNFDMYLATEAAGISSATLQLDSNDPEEGRYEFGMTGKVVTPEIEVYEGLLPDATPIPNGGGPIDFGTEYQYSTGLTKQFTIHNSGEGSLLLDGPVVSLNYGMAEIYEVTIGASLSTTFKMVLPTDEIGTLGGVINFGNNDEDENPFTFSLTGTITPPLFSPENVLVSIDTHPDAPESLHCVDLDQDGDLDVLSASSGDDSIMWYQNDGMTPPLFMAHIITTNADDAVGVYAADLDGDNDIDVLSASYFDDRIVWYENNGKSTPGFSEHTISSDADSAHDVFAIDLDGDNDTDVLSVSSRDDKVAWYENLGGIPLAFTEHVISEDPNSDPYDHINGYANGPLAVSATDVNGDQRIDVLTASLRDRRIAWYENNGGTPPTFTPYTITTDATAAQDVCAVDLDGDGDMDVLSASEAGRTWYENDGNSSPSFISHSIDTSTGAQSIRIADLNADGNLDIISCSLSESDVTWYENDGATPPTFTRYTVATDTQNPISVCSGDVDGDEDEDILCASLTGHKIVWYESDGNVPLLFTSHPFTANADNAFQVHAEDLDADGDQDVLFASAELDRIGWYENMGDHPLRFMAHPLPYSGLFGVDSLFPIDLDGDSDRDLIFCSGGHDKIAWYENNGGQPATFTEYIIVQDPDSDPNNEFNGFADLPVSVYAADVDGDNDIDILSASSWDDRIAWYGNNGLSPPSFTPYTIATDADGARSVFAIDLDDDDDIDVLSASANDDTIAWYENDGGSWPTFTPHIIVSDADYANCVYAADLDGDGDVDVLSAARSDDKVAWHESDGQQPLSFISHTISIDTRSIEAVYAADVDNDGDLDVLTASSQEDKIAWFENKGGTPLSFTDHMISNTADYAESVFAADLDGDGDLDVLSASNEDGKIAWYESRLLEPQPEIEVLVGTTPIPDGGGPFDLGSESVGGSPLSETFTIQNNGSAALLISSTPMFELPEEFTLTEHWDTLIQPRSSDTFTLELSTATAGVFTATISLYNNDSNEDPYDFTVIGSVLVATHTPTLTSTATPTATSTSSFTPTATHTPTRTRTPSSTATSTQTPTATEGSAETFTPTPSPTGTIANTATNTPTITATNTPTITATSTASTTPGPSASPTPTSEPVYDLFPDNQIDQADLLILIDSMRRRGDIDFNGDQQTGWKDLFLFGGQWGASVPAPIP